MKSKRPTTADNLHDLVEIVQVLAAKIERLEKQSSDRIEIPGPQCGQTVTIPTIWPCEKQGCAQ